MIAARKIRFYELQEMCGYSVWSFVYQRNRCHLYDKTRTCCAASCRFWKRLEEIKDVIGDEH
jgi:hypothetical protein